MARPIIDGPGDGEGPGPPGRTQNVVTVPNHKPSAQSAAPGADHPAPDWAERITALAATFHAWLMRPRVRLSVIGVTLLLVGGLIMANSVWTLPLVVAGALMVAVAWIGRRLQGRF